jgi:hypothetical protein
MDQIIFDSLIIFFLILIEKFHKVVEAISLPGVSCEGVAEAAHSREC